MSYLSLFLTAEKITAVCFSSAPGAQVFKANEAKPNKPIIEMIMIPNAERSMLISMRRVSEPRG
jgi:hypothetical protein